MRYDYTSLTALVDTASFRARPRSVSLRIARHPGALSSDLVRASRRARMTAQTGVGRLRDVSDVENAVMM